MLTGFEKLVEERIKKAQKEGVFENLPGKGQPLDLNKDQHVAEELRLAYKMLKNADCLPPELELRKEVERTEQLLASMTDTAERHRTMKKLNYMIMKVNASRTGNFPIRHSSALYGRRGGTIGAFGKGNHRQVTLWC